MADKTKIEWTDATWNPITGCSVVSPGCTNCYAMKLAGTRLKHHPSRAGLTNPSKAGPVWNGKVTLNEQWLDQPLHWKMPRMIFVCAHGDLFAENVPDEWIDKVFAVMAFCPQHTFQVLTKRADRMRGYFNRDSDGFMPAESRIEHYAKRYAREMGKPIPPGKTLMGTMPFPNVWLGVSVEDQPRADERIPALLDTPAAVRFISAEPLLGPLDLARLTPSPSHPHWKRNSLTGQLLEFGDPIESNQGFDVAALDWVIVGGESGKDARPMHPVWTGGLRDQCVKADVPFFFKQWGEWMPRKKCLPIMDGDVNAWPDGTIGKGNANTNGGFGWPLLRVGKKTAGRLLDGRWWDQMPEVSNG